MSTTPEAACATGSLGWDQDLRWTRWVRRWTWGNADPRPLSVTTTHEKARPPAREGSARRRPRSQDGGGEDEARFARGVLLPVAQDLARDLVDAARAAADPHGPAVGHYVFMSRCAQLPTPSPYTPRGSAIGRYRPVRTSPLVGF